MLAVQPLKVNGAGDINLGGSGEEFNMAAMMASMAVANAVGQNIAGSMNNMMSRMNQTIQSSMTLSSLNNVMYYVAVNGQATGPFDITFYLK